MLRRTTFAAAQRQYDRQVPDDYYEDDRTEECEVCEGTGRVECELYKTGMCNFYNRTCDNCDCNDRFVDCDNCNGTGRITRKSECDGCHGQCEGCPV